MFRDNLFSALACVTVFFLCSSCDKGRLPDVHLLESYRFSEDTSLISRVSPPSPVILEHLKKLDKRPLYAPYIPNASEMRIIEKSLEILPRLTRSVLQRHLIGIHFIDDFTGNGLTEWVTDTKGKVYAIMVFNPSVFRGTMSDILTAKEKSCFIQDETGHDIRIDAGHDYNGFVYILIHESTHVVDYVKRITPYVDMTSKRALKLSPAATSFSRNVWRSYDIPVRPPAFSGKISFYGISPPRLQISGAPAVYRELLRSPFASLYGTLSWAEDLAELVTFYHITRELSQPYRISIVQRGTRVLLISPMESPAVRNRLDRIACFYSDDMP